MVYPGYYPESLEIGYPITLKSVNPSDPLTVASTIIGRPSGGGNEPAVFTKHDTKLNGLTITTADRGAAAVACGGNSDYYPVVENCVIRDAINNGGVYTTTFATIKNCVITNNNTGITYYQTGQATIINSLVADNLDYGIDLPSPSEEVIIRNVTVTRNGLAGIRWDNNYSEPNISNSIIWKNGSDGITNLMGTFNKVTYCCLNNGYGDSSKHNIGADPCFVSTFDYHLKPVSQCIDKGDPNLNYTGQTDIDADPRVVNSRIDIGADEFKLTDWLSLAGFLDAWLTHPEDAAWNSAYDYIRDDIINLNDFAVFAAHWGQPTGWANTFVGMSMLESGGQEQMQGGEMTQLDEGEQMLLDSNSSPIYLVYDGNMTPDPNTEITVYLYSDTPLFCMGAGVVVDGDAQIIDAMDTADCNQFGWDPTWNSEPYFESNWVYVSGVKWESDVSGYVAYVTFIYHSGEVSVSFYPEEDWNCAFDEYCEPVPFSQDALIFGRQE